MTRWMQAHFDFTLSAMESIRNQWISVRTIIDDDYTRIERLRARLRGALGSTLLTGLEGEAFDQAIQRYRTNSLRAREQLNEMIILLDRQVSEIRAATQQADYHLGSNYTTHTESILGFVLPDIPASTLMEQGESTVHWAVNAHRHDFMNLVHAAEELVVQGLEACVSDIEAILSNLATWVNIYANRWKQAIEAASSFLNTAIGDVTAIMTIAEDLLKNKEVGRLLKLLDENPDFQWVVTFLTIITDFGSEKEHDLFNYVKDLTSGGLGALLATVVDPEVIAAFAVMQTGSSIMSWEEGKIADLDTWAGSSTNKSLRELGKNWATTASNLNVGHVLDDFGGVIVDGAMTDATFIASTIDPHMVSTSAVDYWSFKTQHDWVNTSEDSARLVVGVAQFKVNAQATIVSNLAVGTNAVIQNTPLPASVKASSAAATNSTVQNMAQVSDLITNGTLPANQPPGGQVAVVGETYFMLDAGF